MTTDTETVVVGAGVIGLSIAAALTAKGHEVTVLERHERPGTETSSRNSEVIHAGIYYPPDSARARLCITGKKMLYDFVAQNAVPHKRCGKIIVATQKNETPQLDALKANALASGVDDLKKLSADDLMALEPALAGHAGVLSPSTGIIDTHALLVALEGHMTTGRGSLILNTQVTDLKRIENGNFSITADSQGSKSKLTARNLILAGGLHTSQLSASLCSTESLNYHPPQTYYAKGHYFSLTGRAPFKHLIYPAPSSSWLGIHLTLDMGGNAKFGPDIEWIKDIDYTFDNPADARKKKFEGSIRRYWPSLPDNALVPGYTGIRPKLYDAGAPPVDFTIHTSKHHGIERFVSLYGIDSPGLTSALAIGEDVTKRLQI